MNTLVSEEENPNHRRPDVQTVDPDLYVLTMAVKAPQTLAHLVELTRPTTKEELDALKGSTRLATSRMDDGLSALITEYLLVRQYKRVGGLWRD